MQDETCYKCKDRYSGCHGNCEKYKEYRKKLDELNRIRREKKNNDYISKRRKRK